MSHYTNYAMTGDGIPEINSLSYASFESGYPAPLPAQRLALVLLEPRVLDSSGDPTLRDDLVRCLQRFKGDLRAEGLVSRFIMADLYRGPVHKDGRIVLALRRFLIDVQSAFANFEGVILVGNFPEASLVRKVSWCPGFLNPRQLAISLELVCTRAEIVLGDLTGNWESLYQEADFDGEDISAIPDAATTAAGWFDGESIRTCEFTSSSFTIQPSKKFRDAFFIDDAIYTILDNTATPNPFLRIALNQAEQNNEVDPLDHSLVNILARPDIGVSRLNALRVAVNPDPTLTGDGGTTFLDAAGNPQTVQRSNAFPSFNEGNQQDRLFTCRDFDLERRLMIDYFNRNHRFRTGAFSTLPFRAAVIVGEHAPGEGALGSGGISSIANAAASDFDPPVVIEHANLQRYVEFLKTPAILKCVLAHSSPRFSGFHGAYDVAAFTQEVGGVPLRWIYRSGEYMPSFEGLGGAADIFTHRALWHHRTLQDVGASLFIHGGCNVNSVNETQTDVYTTTKYAHWNNAEGILWYTNCLTIFSRAKGFNDLPHGFADGYRLSDRANLASCWKSYFNAQANDGSLATYNIQRKRAYFWSLNGDWTLRLRNRNGLGILSLTQALGSEAVHPNRAWIDGWNFDAAVNRIVGIGDVDGDGVDEYVLTSDWGMGLIKYDGCHFRALMTAPRDTWFGGWRYDATVNTGRDRIVGVHNFTGTAKSEIMIWSSWGMTALEYDGTSLSPSRIYPNGKRLGGWAFNTADNVYCGSGRFDADARTDMVLTSPWGLGIISLQRSNDVYMAPNGTHFGGWVLNTADNRIRLIADFDGDGMDEILISSPWGIGVLKMVQGALKAVAMYANGTNLGGYSVQNSHDFALADGLHVGAAKEIVVLDAMGVHVLLLNADSLARQAFAANGTSVDGWKIDTTKNRVQLAGDMNDDGKAEFVIRSPWGVGIMGIDSANHLHTYSMFPFGSLLNDWHLESGDRIVGSGNLAGGGNKKELLIVKA